MTLAIVATAACVAALLGLLASERARSRRGRFVAKPVASAAFIAVAVALGALGGSTYGAWIAVGLVLGAVGDVALMFESNRAFLAGLVAFLLGHVAYVVAFAAVVPIGAWALVAVVPLVAAALVLRWLWPHLGSMRVPVIAYVVVITAMATGGLAAQLASPAPFDRVRGLALTVGALLFFASDIAVAREKFVASTFTNRAWGLPAYYGGQLLLAWSVG